MAASEKSLEKTADASEALAIADVGIKSATDFTNMISGLIVDLLSGKVDPKVANSVCSASSVLLRIMELKYKYGKKGDALTQAKK